MIDAFWSRIGNVPMWISIFLVFQLRFPHRAKMKTNVLLSILLFAVAGGCSLLFEVLPVGEWHYPLFIFNFILWGSLYGILLVSGPTALMISLVCVQICVCFSIQTILAILFGSTFMIDMLGFFTKCFGSVCSFLSGWLLSKNVKELKHPAPTAYYITILTASAISVAMQINQSQFVGSGLSSANMALNAVGSLGILLVVYWQSNRIITQYEQNMVLMSVESQEQANQNLSDEINHLTAEVHQLRHERNHQLTTVSQLIEQNHSVEAQQLIRQLCDQQSSSVPRMRTGNAVLDAVLNHRIFIAESAGIAVTTDVHLDTSLNISASALSSVLSNLLDNAIEGSAGIVQPEIIVKIGPYKGYLSLSVSNRADVQLLKHNPLLQTTKPDSTIHGIGLQVVRRIAECYEGFCDFSANDDGWFHARVMLLNVLPDKAKN